VVMLHGCKTNAAEFDQGTEMSKYGAERNLAVLYPEQNVLYNYDRCWNWFWGSENEIIAEGIRLVQRRFAIDREHTVLMGMSAGAAQGAIMANCHRDLFSAVLLHSGLQYLAATNLNDAQSSLEHGSFTPYHQAAKIGFHCNSSNQPMRFMIVHGDVDQRVNPKNSVESANELMELNRLLSLSNHTQAQIELVESSTPSNGAFLGYRRTEIRLNQNPIGQLLIIHGLAHEWSGGNPIQPRNNPWGPKVIEAFLH
jgi:poly(3-hydroxybutyrate) depolymerase